MASTLEDRYEKLEKVGEGTYGKVYRAEDRDSGDMCALKQCKMELEEEGIPSTALREIAILKELRHPNIVLLKDVEHADNRLHLVFEWVDKDLKKYMDSLARKPTLEMMDMSLCKSWMYQMVRGMDFCHRRGIIHRDLKPQNLLVSKDGVLKIADFGLARAIMIPVRAYTHEVVTLWYRAPEILLGQKAYAPAVDMWSIGAIFAEMVNRHPLWPADCEFDELARIFRTLGTPTEATWPGVSKLPDWNASFGDWPQKPLHKVCPRLDSDGLDLLSRLLAYDPAKRITARDAMAHPWFDDLDKATV